MTPWACRARTLTAGGPTARGRAAPRRTGGRSRGAAKHSGLPRALSGQSRATAHVTGGGGLERAANGDQGSAAVANGIVTNARAGAISGNPPGTPIRLLFKSTL